MGNSSILEEEGYGGGGGGSVLWAPGSPRLSFSRDFVQSDVFTPSSARKDPALIPSASSADFDFGMLALLRCGAADGEEGVELIQNGKLLPIDRSAAAPPRAAAAVSGAEEAEAPRSSIGSDAEIAQITSTHESDQSQPPRHQVPPKSPASSRWKDLLTLNFMRSSSSSSSLSIETEPLNHSSSSSSSKLGSSSSSSRLKLLFRSSSAGAGSRQHQQQLDAQIEPSLGRSASESKVSTCCNNLRVADGDLVVRRPPSKSDSSSSQNAVISVPAETGDDPKSTGAIQRRRTRSCSSSNPHPSPAPNPRRKALAEVKATACSPPAMRSNAANYQRLGAKQANPSNPHQVLPTVKNSSSMDGWRVYSERMSNASSNGGSSVVGGSNNHGVKVAEVLHMEVCMGQSMVVSKVAKAAKAFTKKENAPGKISVRT
ncbi:hypothetical protein SELMODRAFT_417308 [Selaginella moellendorffii]|uniref:Uncharacterized protein n=1 Tax=Selaginella moellendorffii TaxID=88036 RepID=D8S1T8_SELML|nr:hypothetical protein SELMODRAFT_417308 [Selaginella moellendorffii]